jgi:hypothetical protein
MVKVLVLKVPASEWLVLLGLDWTPLALSGLLSGSTGAPVSLAEKKAV